MTTQGPAASPPLASSSGTVLRLLVIDDDSRFADYVRVMLTRARTTFEVESAGTVRDGLHKLATGSYHVCLLDYRLGTEDGLEVVRGAQQRRLRTPIVLLTGEASESLELTALEEGAADYLDKSEIDPRRLERLLCRATARQRAEAALRQREAHLAEAEGKALVMAAHVALDGRWLKVPARLCELLGYSEGELLALRFQDITHPEDVPRDLECRARLIDGSAASIELEKRYLRKDGAVVWVYLNSALVEGEDGAQPYLLTYIRDLSAQKDAEEALATSHQRNARLEEQLNQARKMEAVGRLAGGVAHDFNNLLTAILGYAEVLKERCPDDSRADLEEITKAGTSAAALTRQLLAFSRNQMLKPEVLSVNNVIGGMRNLLSRMLGEDVELLTTFAPGVPAVEADPVQLQQVILNLAANARDAMPHGGRLGVTTTAFVSNGTSTSGALLPEGRYVCITVEDDGVGMDAATRARIFEPFFTTKVQGKGTGLGLATVYGVITQTGGEIVCESEPGRGTRFVIYLPATARKIAAGTPEAPAVGRRGETVLVVEDQDAVRTLTRRILQSRGYTVIDTADPFEAIVIAERAEFDVLLTDVVMPQMIGPELAKRVLASKPQTRVMFMSGYASHAAVEDIKDAPLVQKPFTPAALLKKLDELLQRRR